MSQFKVISLLLSIYWTTGYADVEIVDLSHQHKPGLVVFPGYPSLNFTIMQRGPWPTTNLWVEFNKFETVEHYGTHVDVPSHGKEGKWRLHEVPVKQFMGPAVVIDITERAKTDRDTQVAVSDLESWERKYGEIPKDAIVIMRSGWGEKFPDGSLFLGLQANGTELSLHFPGFHVDAITWLIQNRPKFNGIGVDTISLDHGPTHEFPTHRALFHANKIGYENLANLEALPESGAMFYAAPINLYDGSGCPVRAFGVINSVAGNSSKLTIHPYLLLLIAEFWYAVL